MAISTGLVIDPVGDLDAALARRGEDVTITRPGGASVTCRAIVRQYQPAELIEGSGLIQGDSHAVVSPTDIGTWPDGTSAVSADGDHRVPRRNDKIRIAGRQRNIEAATPIYVAGELVRIDLQVRG